MTMPFLSSKVVLVVLITMLAFGVVTPLAAQHSFTNTIYFSSEQYLSIAGRASGVYTVELLDVSSFANIWRGKVVVE